MDLQDYFCHGKDNTMARELSRAEQIERSIIKTYH